MTDYTEYAWGCFATHGKPRPFLCTFSLRQTRTESQQYIGSAWARENETWRQGWKRAYRNGWRCIRVSVTPLALGKVTP